MASCWFPLLEPAEHREHSEWLSPLFVGLVWMFPKRGCWYAVALCGSVVLVSFCVVLCQSRLTPVVSTAVGTDGCLPGLVVATHCVWLVQCTGVVWFPFRAGLGSTTACVGPCLVHC